MNPRIQEHVIRTYNNLRVGMAVVAFALPIVLLAGSLVSDQIELQGSISAFYHTPMRDILVGMLVSIGTFLYLYKGFSARENTALNCAGVFVIGVALFPTSVPAKTAELALSSLPAEPFVAPYLHGTFALAFFISIAFVCLRCGKETHGLSTNDSSGNAYTIVYRVLGVLMIVIPAVAVALLVFTTRENLVFAVETAAIWVFAAFWLVKSRELAIKTVPLERAIIAGNHAGE